MSGDEDDFMEDDSEDDGVGLVLKDEDVSGRRRKYVVSERKIRSHLPSWCQPSRLSRNERICVVVGVLVLLAIVAVFAAVAIVATRPKAAAAGGGGGGTAQNGTNGTSGGNHTGGGGGEPPVPWANIRLQSTVVPETYDIRLWVDLDTFQVSGSVNISCSVTSDVTYVAFHAKDMEITTHSIYRGTVSVPHDKCDFPENDFSVFNLTKPLAPGPITIRLQFNYILREDLAGFYRSSYMNTNGERQFLATTQFESTDARRAFPCFDEPSFKANFSLRMTHHPRYKTWFNMPAVERSGPDAKGMVTTSFQSSVKMSTYLVAFVVSDFECVNDTIVSISGQDVVIQVCSNPLVVEHTRYALQVAKDVIMFYERVFGVAYPLPKQDLFAIPDFAAGAMENWGLITYRETALLYDESVNPATSKQRVAVVIAHELAHQWFGDLVTMSWWDGLWLNEGFASYMEYLGTNNTEPSFHMLEQFVGGDLVEALDLDGLNESHPIIQEVRNPDEISSLFDAISYSKGASVIRMLEGYIGEDAFKAGITSYLKEHKYGNAETHELWEALQNEAPESVATVTEIMDTWTKQMGYPIFTVNQTTNTLTQTRFFSVKPDDLNSIAASPYQYIWKAPVDFIHYNASGGCAVTSLPLVTTRTTSVQWPSGGWIKANRNQVAFYRVNYEVSNWLKIAEYLNNTVDLEESVLTPNDRAGLLSDAFALSYAGLLDTSVALGNLTAYLLHERDYVPWQVAISWFYRLDNLLSLTPCYGQYKRLVGPLLDSMVTSLQTSSGDLSHLDIYLRSMVLQAAAHFGNDEVVQNATELFRQWKVNNISVDPDLKSLVYGVGIAQGGEEEWQFMWNKYLQSSDSYEKRLYLRAMGRSREPWILNRYLKFSISKIRSQDTLSVITYVSRNIQGRFLAWNFVRDNWSYFKNLYGGDSFFDRFIRYVTASFATDFELQQLKDFFAKNPDAGSATRGFRQTIEVVKGNIAWLNTYRLSSN